MAVRITYFVHGTTSDNEQGRMSGWSDVRLSALGLEQNQSLHDRLIDRSFDAVISSYLRRARDTAKAVFGDRFIVEFDERLRECNYGDYNGQAEADAHIDEVVCIDHPLPNGESYRDVEQRVRSLLTDLISHRPNQHVAFVAHRFPQLSLEVIANGKTWEEALASDWRRTKSWQPGWEYVIPDDWAVQ